MSFTIRESGFLLARIEEQLADNNAGLISAADVRNNIGDAVRSINAIVASGDTNAQFPFYQDVRAKVTVPLVGSAYGGTFVAESGIIFPNAPPAESNQRQTRPFLGVGFLQHNELAGLTDADPHSQYLPVDGSRAMEENLPMDTHWIGPSGFDNDGFKFQYHPTGTTILTSGTLRFADNSKFGSAIGVAKAFASFDGTTTAHYYSYNIHSITRNATGKYTIQLASGVVGSGYTVLAQSNARTSTDSAEDFDRNNACSVIRSGINPSTGRVAFSLNVLNHTGSYSDGKLIDFVVFGSGV